MTRAFIFLLVTVLPASFAAQAQIAPPQTNAPEPNGQETPPDPVPPYIAIGTVDASPGASLMVPIYYTPDSATRLRSFAVEIDFVSNNLAFQEAANGVVDSESLKLTSSVSNVPPDAKGVKRSKIRLVTTTVDAKEELPEGLLAYLMFNLSMDAKPFVIRLSPTVISAEDVAKASVVHKLSARAGSVAVLSSDVTPEMSCFFFTH
jgi:hypothetical protein